MRTFFALLAALVLTLGMVGISDARQPKQQRDSVAGTFDYYLLTLSWSPTFCLMHPDNLQCTGKGYGFVLHGLWPQYVKGGWPEFCPPLTPLSAQERAKGLTLFPTAKLMNHEWTKHGTCSALGAMGYLEAADKALATVQIPQALQPSTTVHYLEATQIAQQFRQSKPGMADNGIAVICSGPELSEVRVCLTKQLDFGPCGKGVKNQCRAGQIRVPPVR